MAKHAKPTMTSTLSTTGARGAAALAMAAVGFLATAPTAFAGSGGDQAHQHHNDEDIGYSWSNNAVDAHESQGIVNVADNTVRVPVQACNNYVPVNALGVQVPIQDAGGHVAAGTDGDGQVGVSPDSCHQTG
ncbi:MAG: hypothetical protein GEU83_19360 [Pseudonocardiaceae bacterium]|nr:hypothetical protein [Pseudonocardiaceae bacterium]